MVELPGLQRAARGDPQLQLGAVLAERGGREVQRPGLRGRRGLVDDRRGFHGGGGASNTVASLNRSGRVQASKMRVPRGLPGGSPALGAETVAPMHAPSIRTAPHGRRTTRRRLLAAAATISALAVAAPATAGAKRCCPARPTAPSASRTGRGQLPRGAGRRPPAPVHRLRPRPARHRSPRARRVHVPRQLGTGEQFLRISGWREQADATGRWRCSQPGCATGCSTRGG